MIQINLNKVNWWKLSTVVLAVAVLFLIPKSCDKSEPSTVIVKTPEVKGTFKTDTIEKKVPIYIPKPFKDRSNEQKLQNDIVELNTQVELYKEELDNAIDRYTYELDSVQKLKAYSEAIALRPFSKKLDDKFITIDFKGYAFGEVKSIETNYTIKPQETAVKVPQLKYRVLAGAGAGINKELNQGIYSFSFGVQNKNANIYSISYLSVGNVKYGVFNYYLNLYTHKK